MEPLSLTLNRWKAALRACAEEGDVESVHGVRTGTRRLEAILELHFGQGKGKASSPERGGTKSLKLLKKLRRAAAPVRDLDVHRHLLEAYSGVGKKGEKVHGAGQLSELERSAVTPEEEKALQEEAQTLDAWLKGRREVYLDRLQRKIHKHQSSLSAFEEKFIETAPSGKSPTAGTGAQDALRLFACLAQRMPLLDAQNLHDFRKELKKVRYRAELAAGNRKAQLTAQKLKQIQDAIGAWHDWVCLAEDARHALGKKQQSLVRNLEQKVAASFEEALATVERVRAELLPAGVGRSRRSKQETPGRI